MMRRGRVTFLALLAAAAAAAPASASEGGIGAPGVGDPFFPLGGNGGIDVRDYALELAYDPATRRLEGTARLSIVATQDLERFDLDLRGFRLGTVTVDGRAAGVLRDGQELMLTPARPLRRGARFTVVVPYSVQMTVPDGLTAVGNGSLAARFSRGGRTTFRWDERYPMAPYLATITLGRFDVARGRTASGIPTYVAVDPTQADASAPALAKLPDMVSFLEQIYGPYPFETVGAIVDDAPDIGYALETQTKPVFSSAPDDSTLLHELSHQWYGDAVTLRTWPDIWLHEGFATWSEWIWSERNGGPSAGETFRDLASTPASDTEFWNPPPGNPGEPANTFDGTIYDRGGMTLEALRERIGDRRFFTVMRRWYAEHRYGNISTPEFIALAERVSGQHLGRFFSNWLYRPGKPAGLPEAKASPQLGRRAEGFARRR